MITPEYVQTLAAYNAEMNRRLYGAAARLSDAERRLARGAFWASVHGTFNHLLWADWMWMSRFDGWDKPPVKLKQSGGMIADFATLHGRRTETDARLETWAARVTPDWLHGELTWFSGASGREMSRPTWMLVAHLFNHQTHHRGQAHGMLTAAGQTIGDTDLPFVI